MKRSGALEAFAWGVPVGGLGGLIGLGGGEFRIPILMRRFKLAPREVVILNAVISLATLTASLTFRGATLSLAAVAPHLVDVAALAAGGLAAAVVAAGLVARLSNEALHGAIVALLVGIGLLLIAEGFLAECWRAPFPEEAPLRFALSLGLGFGIGIVATLLGVAGGELLIPTLIFLHGLDVKTAGTASLMISVVIVATAIARYVRASKLPSRAMLAGIAAPMAVGSAFGAIIGAVVAAFAPAQHLKIVLGAVLLAAAWVSARGSRHG